MSSKTFSRLSSILTCGVCVRAAPVVFRAGRATNLPYPHVFVYVRQHFPQSFVTFDIRGMHACGPSHIGLAVPRLLRNPRRVASADHAMQISKAHTDFCIGEAPRVPQRFPDELPKIIPNPNPTRQRLLMFVPPHGSSRGQPSRGLPLRGKPPRVMPF